MYKHRIKRTWRDDNGWVENKCWYVITNHNNGWLTTNKAIYPVGENRIISKMQNVVQYMLLWGPTLYLS